MIEDISENPLAPWLDIMLAMPTCMLEPPGGDVAYAPGFPPGINWLLIKPRLPFPLPIRGGVWDGIDCADDDNIEDCAGGTRM